VIEQQALGLGETYIEGWWEYAQLDEFFYQCLRSQLEQAQLAKLKLVCEKLYLQPGMRILDIGCGWGGFAKYAATHYGVQVVGITISEQQYQYAKVACKDLPIEIRFQD
jgi:cyclopropane-fatty-acyl-phospholipid synthase